MQEENINLGNENEDNGQKDNTQLPNQGELPKTYTEEEFKKALQSESDRRVNQALETFRKETLPIEIEQARSEAEKIAQMTANEKAKHEKEQSEIKYKKREEEITKRELRIEAHNILNEKKLPVELLEVLNYTNADNLNDSILAVEKAFQVSVEQAVNERLRGETPKQDGNTKNASFQERLDEARKNNNNIEAIKIKQEAAQKGDFLI